MRADTHADTLITLGCAQIHPDTPTTLDVRRYARRYGHYARMCADTPRYAHCDGCTQIHTHADTPITLGCAQMHPDTPATLDARRYACRYAHYARMCADTPRYTHYAGCVQIRTQIRPLR